jgi:hypothetical protein
MSSTGPGGENFDETLRAIAGEVGRFVERALDRVDLDDVADSVGVDPGAAREWVESAGGWLRAQTEGVGEELARRAAQSRPQRVDPLAGAQPHPLDMPTEEQGLALAALDSGRWTVEPGTEALAAKGEGPAPRDALGIVRELRVRDWIGPDGELTQPGRHALGRWLAAAEAR